MPVRAADVGVSVSVGQPGFYGRIDIGDFPPPQLIYAQPMIIERRQEYGPPLYLRVPPGHIKNWRKHCHEYNACGERVYFVQDDWYNREYVPRYQQRYQNRHEDIRDDHNDHDGGRNDNQPRDNAKEHRNDKHDNDRGH